MYPTMDRIKFGEWLRTYRATQGLSQSDLARKTGLHRQIINKTENGVSEPTLKTYIALANGLNMSLISILRIAGELPPGDKANINFEDWEHLLSKMTPAERDEMRDIGMMKIERRQKEQALKTLKARHN